MSRSVVRASKDSEALTDAYDKAALAMNSIDCAAALLAEGGAVDRIPKLRAWLVASITDNVALIREGLDGLNPYSVGGAK